MKGENTRTYSGKIVQMVLSCTSGPLTATYSLYWWGREVVYLYEAPKCNNEVGRMQAIGHSQHRHDEAGAEPQANTPLT